MIFALSSLMLEHSIKLRNLCFFLSAKFVANLFAVFMTVLLAFPADFQRCSLLALMRASSTEISGNRHFVSAGPVRLRWLA